MAKTGMYVGLDIGTTSVKVIVAEYVDSQMNIIGVGNAKSEGVNTADWANCKSILCTLGRLPTQPAIAT